MSDGNVAKSVSGKVASWLVDRVLKILFSYVDPSVLSMYIENGWSIVDAIQMALNEDDGYIKSVSPDGYGDLAVHIRRALIWAVDAVMGIIETIVRRYGVDVLDKYMSADYVLNYLKNNRPELYDIITSYGDEGVKWLAKQLKELKMFFLGKAVWDPDRKRTVYLD